MNNYKFAGLRVGGGNWVIGVMEDGTQTMLAKTAVSGLQVNHWYALDLVVAGDGVTLYADNQSVVSWQPGGGRRIPGGQVGLMAERGSAEFEELEQWDVGQVTKYYAVGGQRIALRRDNALYYVHTDHLGSTSLLTTEAGQEAPGTRLRYYPYGAPRPDDQTATHDAFALDYTAATFTGQRREVSTGLMYYGARFYDPALGRFIQADTIVAEPGNPQALNRYSYVLGNPLRYTDPTGMFSEDEIMKYLGVEKWENVLAMFEDNGQFAGMWGILGLLRDANLGDRITAYEACPSAGCAKPAKGILREHDGQLVLEGNETWDFASLVKSTNVYLVHRRANYLNEGGYRVFERNHRYNGLRFKRDIDWVGVGFDIGGVAADAVSFGAAGRVVNAVQVANNARKIGQALDVTGAAYNLGAGAVEWYQEGHISGETARSVGYSAAGFIPGLGTLSDAVSAIDGIFYWGP